MWNNNTIKFIIKEKEYTVFVLNGWYPVGYVHCTFYNTVHNTYVYTIQYTAYNGYLYSFYKILPKYGYLSGKCVYT